MLTTEPDLIEKSDFTGGWAPDGVTDSEDPSLLVDALNVLLDRNTGALQARPGFRRLRDALAASFYIKQVFFFGGAGDERLICVLTDESANANNVQLWAVNLITPAAARFDTTGVTWDNPTKMFWFQSIDGILYGGSQGNKMFSWDLTTYNADAATGNWKTLVTATGVSVDTATEYGRDYAFRGKEHVIYGTDIFIPNRSVRYDAYEDGERYQKEDKVTVSNGYYKVSYRCVQNHVAVVATNGPLADTAHDFWQKKRLPLPRNDDDEVSDAWTFVPAAAETSVAMWFADRLFLRFDGHGDKSRAQYSAPVKPDKDEDIANVSWNPKDWAPGSDMRGQGGGWLPFNDGSKGGVITAMRPFGQYGIVFKREAVWVLSGSDDTTWTVRRLARGRGCVGSQATLELDGLVYFLSDDGLYVTDGTAVEPVKGLEKVQRWFRTRMDSSVLQSRTDGHEPCLFHWNGFVGISIPDVSQTAAADRSVTVFYDPATSSFWKTNLPVLHAKNFRDKGVEKLAFARSPASATDDRSIPYIFDMSTAAGVDDTGAAVAAYTPITWHLQTGFLAFSTKREQRRVRRTWWVVKGAVNFTIKVFKDWATSATTMAARAGAATTSHIEGTVVPDSHSVSMYLSGDEAPASILGYAIDTQPRRDRYHA